ncbi:glycosyltransferase family A protein [Bacteroides sp. ET225]|uniref:glycosyltransferase family 2 protein n=1 Tax=Bacteroides sp. ET225 TaxID=2972461 RepID=UPI0021ACDCC6|nr:glycosyltransferase family A protein [Bacteroides sp. ET225]MCR8916920.1 glycosyltransferase family 2 protein [Bacteroides sp. ET225]
MLHPKVSIIVPIYNAAKYLYKCLDTLLTQTYYNYEIILIDDGSNDSSFLICKQYLKKSDKVKLFHKENGGVSSARNLGIEKAEGQWITFVDSDDWVSPFYLEHLIGHISEGVDLVFSYAVLIGKDGIFLKEKFPSKMISSDDLEIAFAENAFHGHTSPWSKLYKKDLIDQMHLRFDEQMHIGEDLLFLYKYILLCNKIFISSDTDYFYNYEVDSSLTKQTYSLESELSSYCNIFDIVTTIISVKQFKNKKALSNIRWIKGYYSRRILNALYQDKHLKRKERIRLINQVDIASYLNTFNIPATKERLLAFLLRHHLFRTYDTVRFLSHKYFK